MSYDASSIRKGEGLDYVRLRPTGYVIDTAIAGQLHCALEIVHNNLDETSLMNGAGLVDIVFIPDLNRNTYQLIIRDNGRGIPHESLKDVYTALQTSGKFDQDAYAVSSGMYGVGSKATAGLSNYFVGITQREDCLSRVAIERGKVKDHELRVAAPVKGIRGTTVVYEPDDSIMSDTEEFCTVGYDALLEMCRKFCVFGNVRFVFRISTRPIKSYDWRKSVVEMDALINSYIDKSEIVFDSLTMAVDPDEFLKKYWHVERPFAWTHIVNMPVRSIPIEKVINKRTGATVPATLLYGFSFRTYYVRYNSTPNAMGLVNNVPIDHAGSIHIRVLSEVYKNILASMITVPQIKEFFLASYRLPLLYAVDMKRSAAEFTGTTKHAYYDKTLEPIYRHDLEKILTSEENKTVIETLFNYVYQDVESKYQAMQGVAVSSANMSRIHERLKRPDKFDNCETSDRSIAELFLSEGDSAGAKQILNSRYQGIYRLSGKPFNGITGLKNRESDANEIRTSAIYSDIFTLLNVNPYRPDFSSMYFEKVIIMADADSHGDHIKSLTLSNLYVACPQLIENGHVYLLVPPLYRVKLGDKKDVYVRDADSMNEWRSRYLYQPSIEVAVYPKAEVEGLAPGHILDVDEYVGFAQRVSTAGDALARAADAFAVEPRVIEYMASICHLIEDDTLDISKIVCPFEGCVFRYDESSKALLLVTPERDMYIPLAGMRDTLERLVIPHLDRLLWRDIEYRITTRHSTYARNKPMMISEIAHIFEQFNDTFSTKRYKGIGSMEDSEVKSICFNIDRRQLYKITDIGDVDRIFALLGDDPTERKKLVAGY